MPVTLADWPETGMQEVHLTAHHRQHLALVPVFVRTTQFRAIWPYR